MEVSTVAATQHLPVLYLSANFLVVDKPADLLINSDDSSCRSTVHRILAQQFPELVDTTVSHGFRFCHRLDYSTSGVLCVGLNKRAAALAGRAFEERTTIKHYVALVRGHVPVPPDGGDVVIDVGVGNDTRPDHKHRMCTADEPHCGPPRRALTRLTPLAYGTYDGVAATKVRLVPHTGRRHQLRVHCHSIGHTVIGDYTYSDRKDVDEPRMFLHAHRLQLCAGLEWVDALAPDPFGHGDEETDGRWVVTQNFDADDGSSLLKSLDAVSIN